VVAVDLDDGGVHIDGHRGVAVHVVEAVPAGEHAVGQGPFISRSR
jgi:hypothetical protein